jgi:hypothetical protein
MIIPLERYGIKLMSIGYWLMKKALSYGADRWQAAL